MSKRVKYFIFDVLIKLNLAVKRRKFYHLPITMSLFILRNYYIFPVSKEKYSILEFYGKFKKKKSKTMYLIFKSIEVESEKNLSREIPLAGIHFFSFSWYNYLPISYFKQMKSIRAFSKVFLNEDHSEIISKVNSETLNNLYFECEYLTNDIVSYMNNMKNLKNLAIFVKLRMQDIGDEDQKEKFVNILVPYVKMDVKLKDLRKLKLYNVIYDRLSFDLKKLESLEVSCGIVKNQQLTKISNLPNLRRLKFFFCNLEKKYFHIFNSISLVEISILDCQFDHSSFEKLKIVKNTKLKSINLKGLYFVSINFVEQILGIELRKLQLECCNLQNEILAFIQAHAKWEKIFINLKWNRDLSMKLVEEFREKKQNYIIDF